MKRAPLSGLILGLLLIGFGGVLLASEADELRERAKSLRKEASSMPERAEQESRKLLAAADQLELQAKKREESADRPSFNASHEHRDGQPELRPEFRAQIEKLEVATRRIHHLRVAAENLERAEVHDVAHKIMKEADAMERDVQEVKKHLAAQIQKSQGGEHGPNVVRELRAEIEKLRAEVKDLRRQVEDR
jgi:hypothetical protein